ncbi:MAG: hypothetical protein ACK587_03290 [Cyanobacteriota bacterium]
MAGIPVPVVGSPLIGPPDRLARQRALPREPLDALLRHHQEAPLTLGASDPVVNRLPFHPALDGLSPPGEAP